MRPGSIVLAGVKNELRDRIDGDARGDLTGCVATHSIRNEEQSRVVLNEKGILVVLPLPSHVRQSV
jgi:hypothetical protein